MLSNAPFFYLTNNSDKNMKSEIIFEEGSHKWIVLGRDAKKEVSVIDTNEYLIVNNKQGLMLDPGGTAIFPQVLTELSRYIPTENIKTIVASHQDPDIASSLSMWLDLCPEVKVYCSWLWTGFLSHFGMGATLRLEKIPDDGMELPIGNTNAMVYLVPAHYCHSSGNFSCYDPKADILFSGDIGSALLPNQNQPLFVENFDEHTGLMKAFHQRWMPSKDALEKWVKRIRLINPSVIAPQHGSIFKGEDVGKLLDWLDNLDVGIWDSVKEDEDINESVWMKWKK